MSLTSLIPAWPIRLDPRVSPTLLMSAIVAAITLYVSPCLAQNDPPPDPAGETTQPTAEELVKAQEKAQKEAQAQAQAAQAEKEAEQEIQQNEQNRDYETVVKPDAPIRKLEVMIRPMRKDRLEEEIEHWLELLKEKAGALALKEYAAETAEEGGRQVLLEEATTLREERNALVQRVRVVINRFETRGGDAEEYRLYVRSVADIVEDVGGDWKAAWIAIKAWAVSKEGGKKWAGRMGAFFVTIIIAWIVARLIGGIARQATRGLRNSTELLRTFIATIVRRSVFWVGVIIGVSQLGVDMGPMLAAIGAAGFVIAFALQGTLSNFASGLMILMYRPFDVGDAVEVSGVSGKVMAMTLVSTTISTFDNKQVIVPNNSIWGNVITNITGNKVRRVDMVFGIGYADDADKARSILERIVGAHEKVLKDPEPTIKMHELGDSSVNFIVRPWSRTSDYWDVYWDVTRQVKASFDAEGVGIPFPQRDLHVPGEITVRVASD